MWHQFVQKTFEKVQVFSEGHSFSGLEPYGHIQAKLDSYNGVHQ